MGTVPDDDLYSGEMAGNKKEMQRDGNSLLHVGGWVGIGL